MLGDSEHDQADDYEIEPSGRAWDLQNLSDSLDEYPLLASLERHTGIRKTVLALVILLTVVSFVSWGVGMPILIMLFGTAVPLHTTLDALRTKNMAAMKHMLCYWSLFSIFLASEKFLEVFLSWIPMLNPIKLVFLFVCYSPVYEGASLVYLNIIRPIIYRPLPKLKRYVSLFGRAINLTRASVCGIVLNTIRRIIIVLRQVSTKWVAQQDALRASS